jgi:proteasome lid subunit RPN8/RPN11
VNRLVIPAALAERVRRHLAAALPEEGCGLLSGSRESGGLVSIAGVHESPNVASGDRRTAYRVDPRLQLDLQRRLRIGGLDVVIVGAFHSHPAGPPAPSRRDLDEALPGFAYVVGAPDAAGVFALRAFALDASGSGFAELPILESPR